MQPINNTAARPPLSCLHFAILTVLAAPVVHAETVLPVVQVMETPEESGLGQVSSTGSRLGLTLYELPASAEGVDSDTMQRRGDYSVSEAITRTAGMTAIGSGGNGGMAFSVRGFSGTNSVGVAEDGLRLATGAGTQTYPSDSWGYERIEVLRGPASVVYGSGTVGATINAVRKAPSRESSMEALLGIGTDGLLRAGIGGTGAVGESASFRIDAYGHKSDGTRDLGDSKGGKFMSTLQLQPSSNLQFQVLADYSDQRPERYWGTPHANGRIDGSLRDENYNVSDSIIRYEDSRLRGRVEWKVNDWLGLKNEIYHFGANRHWKNVEQYQLDTATNTVDRSDYLEIKHDMAQAGNRLEATLTGNSHRGVLGWEIAKVDFRHINNSPFGGSSTVSANDPVHGQWSSPDPTLPKFQTETILHGFYAEDAFNLSDRWLLLGGVRHDIADISRDDLVGAGTDLDAKLAGTAWRLGLTYLMSGTTSLYALASTGHDPVTSLVTMNLSNKDFSLTRGRQVEVGIKQGLPKGLGEWTAALYRIEKDDIITRDPLNPAISVQGGSQHSNGVEITANITPHKNWRLEGNLALLDARYDELIEAGGADRSGNRPVNVPEIVSNLWVHYRMASWELSLGARHVGKRYGNNSNTIVLPAYTVADAALSWQYDKKTDLRFLARNLTDKVYATTSYGSNQFILGEARRFEVVAEMKF